MESFISRYLKRVEETNSVLCVGLDPTIEHVPPGWRSGDNIDDIKDYCSEVINIAAPLVPVVKLQFAYYGALGLNGPAMMVELIDHAHNDGLLVILDAKRADIGETMEQYGNEVFGIYHADACTFVPYLGSTFNPSWMKWLKEGRMVISMIRTSNPEAEMIQDIDLKEGDLKIYERLALLVADWNKKVVQETDGLGAVGGVIGATWPEQASRCRQLAGDDVFSLIPGYGAQGGGADGAVAGLPNSRGKRMGVVNSSRGITLTSWWDKGKKQPRQSDPLDLVKAAIVASNADLNAALERKLGEKVF
jgi:orotidine-5'-phosphate decarboxylase